MYHDILSAWKITTRQRILEESIGALEMENEAYQNVFTIIYVCLPIFIIGPIVSSCAFKLINSSFHQCQQIIAEEIKKEKADKKCC